MPTLTLFDPTAHPDGWHNVRSPGGYEWWYFDAEDHATNTQIVVILMEGFIFHPSYLRAYEKFIRRPTKRPPPTAGDFPSAYACIYRNGKIWKQFFTQYRREDFVAKSDRVDVRIGPNRLWVDDGGSYRLELTGTPWKLTARGPITQADESMRVSMTFKPMSQHPPIERTFLSRKMTGADHRWTIAAPRCEVSGTVSATEEIQISGRGYHDHNYGTAPIRQGLHRWAWGRAMFEDRVLTFHYAQPQDENRSPEVHLVEVAADHVRDIEPTRVDIDWSLACKPAMMLRYPATIRFGDDLKLSNPRVVDPSPFYMRIAYDAESRGQRSQAFCEVAYPHRLSWPILGRMIEMSFDKRPTKNRPA